MSPFELTRSLVACPSITPGDGGAWSVLIPLVENAGFRIELVHDGELRHLVATWGAGSPTVALSGHVDVVPPGVLTDWLSDPFDPAIRDGHLYGRGAADMKGGVACLTHAAIRYASHGGPGCIKLIFTSDEEGSGEGARILADTLGDSIDYVLVGEPTSINQLGDEFKVGRRGSVSAEIAIHGVQGHTAYAHLAKNPIHLAAPFLADLTALTLDEPTEQFPASSLQVSSIEAGAGAGNVIPGLLTLHLNSRNSPETPAPKLQALVEDLIRKHKLDASINWSIGAEPFLTNSPAYIEVLAGAIEAVTGNPSRASTAGGTSDGRAFAAHGIPTLEFGAINATIHAANERTSIDDLDLLADIYFEFLSRALSSLPPRSRT